MNDLYPDAIEIGCRPDFLVHFGRDTLCIETMDSADKEYRSRKVGMHHLMGKIGPVLEDERIGVAGDMANRTLIDKVFAALRKARMPP